MIAAIAPSAAFGRMRIFTPFDDAGLMYREDALKTNTTRGAERCVTSVKEYSKGQEAMQERGCSEPASPAAEAQGLEAEERTMRSRRREEPDSWERESPYCLAPPGRLTEEEGPTR